SVVLDFRKSDVNSCLELLEYQGNEIHTIKINSHWKGEVVKFETNYTRTLEDACFYRLGDIYEIRVSPRTPEIKNSFFIEKEKPVQEEDYLPLLNGRNLKCNKISYDIRTGYWVKKSDANKLRGYFETPHIVVGLGFRENGKVAGALDERCYPWMGDIYHLLRKDDLFGSRFDMSESEILEYLNSDYVQKYVKGIYREITYHLSISQLKSLPLPTKSKWEKIKSWKNL
ncbi:MAG: TaqI-like C-terminal specificity domain-containing protein, partial [Candidatus Poribacteria bacterium]